MTLSHHRCFSLAPSPFLSEIDKNQSQDGARGTRLQTRPPRKRAAAHRLGAEAPALLLLWGPHHKRRGATRPMGDACVTVPAPHLHSRRRSLGGGRAQCHPGSREPRRAAVCPALALVSHGATRGVTSE